MTTPQLQQTFRRRLLDGLAESIVAVGYRETTVADIVRRARTSRRTFYEHFAGKEECFVALLRDANAEMITQISAAVDPSTRWVTQVRQAIGAWIACAESQPGIVVSWIRDVPALGASGRDLQREMMAAFIRMVQTLSEADEWRAVRPEGVSRQLAILMLGGLRELIATTVEEGGRAGDITEVAVNATIALLAPPESLSLPS
ncbi:TetR/AcrR family transcriptional regulator [Actinophytocola oryzae]|uniref:TetR/AcrR family transcriptional regulator n=1 Tax=Actinophytocola oryzae TaxID=502181 RepID=UPI001FBABD51|nr:TetR/AcrR family transcriptional regulator [Actinophytocola oryzae]